MNKQHLRIVNSGITGGHIGRCFSVMLFPHKCSGSNIVDIIYGSLWRYACV